MYVSPRGWPPGPLPFFLDSHPLGLSRTGSCSCVLSWSQTPAAPSAGSRAHVQDASCCPVSIPSLSGLLSLFSKAVQTSLVNVHLDDWFFNLYFHCQALVSICILFMPVWLHSHTAQHSTSTRLHHQLFDDGAVYASVFPHYPQPAHESITSFLCCGNLCKLVLHLMLNLRMLFRCTFIFDWADRGFFFSCPIHMLHTCMNTFELRRPRIAAS